MLYLPGETARKRVTVPQLKETARKREAARFPRRRGKSRGRSVLQDNRGPSCKAPSAMFLRPNGIVGTMRRHCRILRARGRGEIGDVIFQNERGTLPLSLTGTGELPAGERP